MPDLSDTIVAEATPPGRGALRVLRLSGPRALAILGEIFRAESGEPPARRPRTAVLGRLVGDGGLDLDQCLALAFPEPASFTGEDCAELHLHGSPGLMRGALALCQRLGARPALPGEFSYRAFLGGKLSLLDAESANTLTACEAGGQAARFGPGAAAELESDVRSLLSDLQGLEARAEAAVDFPEEVPDSGNLGADLAALERSLVAFSDAGMKLRPLREGWKVALVGAPNAGKSSLFNALLRRERALVSPHPGTTRDVLVETLEVGGLPLTLLDTAGGRETGDAVERLGVEAALRAAREADATLLVFDGSRGWEVCDQSVLKSCPSAPLVLLANKADRGISGEPAPEGIPLLRTSAVTGEGLDALLAIFSRWMEEALPSGSAPMNARQAGAALAASRSLAEAGSALSGGFTEEVALQGIRGARRHLEELLGGGDPETLYDRIFASFCLGK